MQPSADGEPTLMYKVARADRPDATWIVPAVTFIADTDQ